MLQESHWEWTAGVWWDRVNISSVSCDRLFVVVLLPEITGGYVGRMGGWGAEVSSRGNLAT